MNSNARFSFVKPWIVFLTLGFLKITATHAVILPEFIGGITPTALHSLSNHEIENIFVHCLKTTHTKSDYRACIVPILTYHGASVQSVAFAKQFGSWMSTFQTYNNIAVIKANTIRPPNHHQLVFINNSGVALDSDDPSIVNATLLTANQEYQTLLSAYPAIKIGLSTHITTAKQTSNGDQEFYITYPLVNGCMTCQRLGNAVLSIQFNTNGLYQKTSLISVTPTV